MDEQILKKWISVDDQIKNLNEQLKGLRENRTALGNVLTKQLPNNTFVPVENGKIKVITTKVTAPLTFKYLEKSLGEIIHNKEQVTKIVTYLKEKREVELVEEIKRVYNNE
jgi:regulator of replication initiation timing